MATPSSAPQGFKVPLEGDHADFMVADQRYRVYYIDHDTSQVMQFVGTYVQFDAVTDIHTFTMNDDQTFEIGVGSLTGYKKTDADLSQPTVYDA